jgi:hypothetical protein
LILAFADGSETCAARQFYCAGLEEDTYTCPFKGIALGRTNGRLKNMIPYHKDPKNSTPKLLDIINSFSNMAGYKINLQKSLTFLYTNNE